MRPFHCQAEIAVDHGKQAKVHRISELQRLRNHVSYTRRPERDRVMVLLSFKAGLRPKVGWSFAVKIVRGRSRRSRAAIFVPQY